MKARYALLAAVAAGSAALLSATAAVRSASSAGEAFTGLWTAQPRSPSSSSRCAGVPAPMENPTIPIGCASPI